MIGGFGSGIPPRRAFLLATSVAAVTLAFAYSTPGVDLVTLFWGTWLCAGLGAAWAVRLVRALQNRQLPTPTRADVVRWAAVPVILLGALGLGRSGAALELRWLASVSALDETVQGLPPVDVGRNEIWPSVPLPRTVGLYPVVLAEQVPAGGTVFRDSYDIVADGGGFAHLPQGPDPDLFDREFEHVEFRHLGWDWYAWVGTVTAPDPFLRERPEPLVSAPPPP
jgi:hypothetical protein